MVSNKLDREKRRSARINGREKGGLEGGAERKTAGLCNRILREYDSRISSWCLFTYKVRNVTVFFYWGRGRGVA